MQVGKIGSLLHYINMPECIHVTMLEAHIRALEQSTMIALTLFASQSKQIIIKILDLKVFTVAIYCDMYRNTTLFIAIYHNTLFGGNTHP